MTDLPPNAQNPEENATNDVAQELLRRLRQKQGNWVEWGAAIASLLKTGYNPQEIFEATGFEPIQQNQVVVGSQVYNSLEKFGVSEATRSHYGTRGSDVLYELRLLTQEERAAAAELIFVHNVDADEAREIAKALKEFSYYRTLPEGFSAHPGDAVAHQVWKLARQNADLQQRFAPNCQRFTLCSHASSKAKNRTATNRLYHRSPASSANFTLLPPGS